MHKLVLFGLVFFSAASATAVFGINELPHDFLSVKWAILDGRAPP